MLRSSINEKIMFIKTNLFKLNCKGERSATASKLYFFYSTQKFLNSVYFSGNSINIPQKQNAFHSLLRLLSFSFIKHNLKRIKFGEIRSNLLFIQRLFVILLNSMRIIRHNVNIVNNKLASFACISYSTYIR